MRDAFFAELLDLFAADRRMIFLTGDLGYKLFDALAAVDPSRVINFGIREAAMVGFASGLAEAGMLPVVYSITPFVTLRCLEQIKLELCYNRRHALLVGVGGGYAYGRNGATHHGIEDLGLMRAMGGMRVFAPCDPWEVRGCVRRFPGLDGPAYLRLGRNGEPRLRPEPVPPDPDAPFYQPNARQGLLVTTGCLLSEAQAAAGQLAARGGGPAVLHLPCLSPLPEAALLPLLRLAGPVLVAEEHIRPGGLGEALARFMLENGIHAPFASLAIPAQFPERCLSRAELLAASGIDAAGIVRAFNALSCTTTSPDEASLA
ncbi:transketolase family protein [Solidesulfovibrio sp.]|uniref:transketolase family protein n=1 Tax=Solidesulfovibrio sp. TaxID=2910990 RepID=UPI002B21C89A|nr:transketolase C-terminal domain-containing protein [Solidesulfovibrio sp.]MEA5088427.1 transketolase C-terminal domain-containing protein [Solidesulfovibrio sp.]